MKSQEAFRRERVRLRVRRGHCRRRARIQATLQSQRQRLRRRSASLDATNHPQCTSTRWFRVLTKPPRASVSGRRQRRIRRSLLWHGRWIPGGGRASAPAPPKLAILPGKGLLSFKQAISVALQARSVELTPRGGVLDISNASPPCIVARAARVRTFRALNKHAGVC